MAPTARLVQEERRTRWFRRIAPVAVLLAILVLLMIPGMLAERRPEDATTRAGSRPLTHVTPTIGGEQVIGPSARSRGPVVPIRAAGRG